MWVYHSHHQQRNKHGQPHDMFKKCSTDQKFIRKRNNKTKEIDSYLLSIVHWVECGPKLPLRILHLRPRLVQLLCCRAWHCWRRYNQKHTCQNSLTAAMCWMSLYQGQTWWHFYSLDKHLQVTTLVQWTASLHSDRFEVRANWVQAVMVLHLRAKILYLKVYCSSVHSHPWPTTCRLMAHWQ